MKILALDLATKTGWCVGEHDAEPNFGTYALPKTDDDIGRFLVAFEDWLVGMMALEDPELVVFEAPIFLGGRNSNIMTARKLMGLANQTEVVCYRRGVTCREGHLQKVKKFFAGHGRAEKADMIAAARRFGFAVTDDNQADSVGLWCFTVHSRFLDQRHRWSLGQMGARAA